MQAEQRRLTTNILASNTTGNAGLATMQTSTNMGRPKSALMANLKNAQSPKMLRARGKGVQSISMSFNDLKILLSSQT